MSKKHYIGNMLFEDYCKLSYKEQNDYISSLSTSIIKEGEEQSHFIEIDDSMEDYVNIHNLISLEELKERMSQLSDKGDILVL